MAFCGNQYRTITSIDVSGGIVCPRTTGQVPFIVQASAQSITAVGATKAFKDLEFRWDFGDTGSLENFTNPGVCGGTVNTNDDIVGPHATHTYRTPGTYTVTLTVRGYQSPFIIKKVVTQEIVVSAFDASGGVLYVDSVAGSDANNGLTSGAPKQTVSAIQTFINGPSHIDVRVKRGSTFDGSSGLKIWNTANTDRTGFRLSAYGSGAKPIFNLSSGSDTGIQIQNGGGSSPSAKSDVVISDIVFSTDGTATSAPVLLAGNGHATATMRGIYTDNCEFRLNNDNADGYCFIMSGYDMEDCGQWNCIKSNGQVRTHSALGALIGMKGWYVDVAGSYNGGTNSAGTVFDHHTYPSVRNDSLHLWIDFQEGTNRNYCINLNWDRKGSDAPEYADRHVISGCNMTGTLRAHDASNGLAPPDPNISRFRSVICQFNRIHDLTGDGIILFYCAEDYTYRYNEGWGNDGAAVGFGNFITPADEIKDILTLEAYGNKHYRSAAVTDGYFIRMPGFTLLPEITDNIVVDLRAIAKIALLTFTAQVGALIDRNQHWFPNDSNSKPFYDGVTEKTYAQWQAQGYDLSGSVADPNWPDAANGDFGTNGICIADSLPEPEVQVISSGGGGAAHPIKIKHEKERKQLLKKQEQQLEQTIRLAYQRLTGKVTEPPQLKQDLSPPKLAVLAEKMAAQLVEKSKNSAKQRTRNKEIIKDLQRQAAAIMQEEEEAIVMLLH